MYTVPGTLIPFVCIQIWANTFQFRIPQDPVTRNCSVSHKKMSTHQFDFIKNSKFTKKKAHLFLILLFTTGGFIFARFELLPCPFGSILDSIAGFFSQLGEFFLLVWIGCNFFDNMLIDWLPVIG